MFAELQDAVQEVLPTLREQGISVYILSESCPVQGITTLCDKMSQVSDQPLSRELRANVTIKSTALFIYTSGTTGERVEQPAAGLSSVYIVRAGDIELMGKEGGGELSQVRILRGFVTVRIPSA